MSVDHFLHCTQPKWMPSKNVVSSSTPKQWKKERLKSSNNVLRVKASLFKSQKSDLLSSYFLWSSHAFACAAFSHPFLMSGGNLRPNVATIFFFSCINFFVVVFFLHNARRGNNIEVTHTYFFTVLQKMFKCAWTIIISIYPIILPPICYVQSCKEWWADCGWSLL